MVQDMAPPTLKRIAAKKVAKIALLAMLASCGGGGAPAPSEPAPAPVELTAPDINRAARSGDPIGEAVYPVAAFHRSIVNQGAHFTLEGQFTSEQTTTQRQRISRSALASSPTAWMDRSDLTRTVITVDRFEDGVASKSDTYADYFDPDNQLVGSRTRGASTFSVAQEGLSKPVTARVGESGNMLSLSDGTPAYCEKTQELNASNQVAFTSELCHGLDANGQTNQRVTYSYSADGSSGSLVSSDFAIGPNNSDNRLVDGAPFSAANTGVDSSERRIDCRSAVDGPLDNYRWYLGDPVPESLSRSTFLRTFKVSQGVLFAGSTFFDATISNFIWDSFEREYVVSRNFQEDGNSVLVNARFDDQLRVNYYKEHVVDPTENRTFSLECYDGVVDRVVLAQDGPTSVLQCVGRIAPSYDDLVVAQSLTVTGGRVSVTRTDTTGFNHEIDLLLVDEHFRWGISSYKRRNLEVLPDGWRRWSETKVVFQDSQLDIEIEFDEQGNIRRYDRRGSERGEPSNYYECLAFDSTASAKNRATLRMDKGGIQVSGFNNRITADWVRATVSLN